MISLILFLSSFSSRKSIWVCHKRRTDSHKMERIQKHWIVCDCSLLTTCVFIQYQCVIALKAVGNAIFPIVIAEWLSPRWWGMPYACAREYHATRCVCVCLQSYFIYFNNIFWWTIFHVSCQRLMSASAQRVPQSFSILLFIIFLLHFSWIIISFHFNSFYCTSCVILSFISCARAHTSHTDTHGPHAWVLATTRSNETDSRLLFVIITAI